MNNRVQHLDSKDAEGFRPWSGIFSLSWTILEEKDRNTNNVVKSPFELLNNNNKSEISPRKVLACFLTAQIKRSIICQFGPVAIPGGALCSSSHSRGRFPSATVTLEEENRYLALENNNNNNNNSRTELSCREKCLLKSIFVVSAN